MQQYKIGPNDDIKAKKVCLHSTSLVGRVHVLYMWYMPSACRSHASHVMHTFCLQGKKGKKGGKKGKGKKVCIDADSHTPVR